MPPSPTFMLALRSAALVAVTLAAGPSVGSDIDAIRNQLQDLKALKEAGLVTEQDYSREVARVLRRLDGAAADDRPAPPATDTDFPLPTITWGRLEDYFERSGLRTGLYAYRTSVPVTEAGHDRPPGDRLARARALIVEVKAKQSFRPDVARFDFRGYSAQGDLVIPSTPVAFDRHFQQPDSEFWPVGAAATAYLPFYEQGLDPHRVAEIRVSVQDVTDFRLPTLHWGALKDYFEVTNPRTGVYKYLGAGFDRTEGETRTRPRAAPAIVFDVRASRSFLGRVRFQAVGYDSQGNLASPNIDLVFDSQYHKRSGFDWTQGDRAVAYLPFKQPGFDPAVIDRVELKITDPYDFRLPAIDWTVFKELFKVSKLRTGPYYASEQQVFPAIVFDVEAKFAFPLTTAYFAARLYDQDGKTLGSARAVEFEREFFARTARDSGTTNRGQWSARWPRGGRATAYIPFNQASGDDVDPASVARIHILQGYGQVIR